MKKKTILTLSIACLCLSLQAQTKSDTVYVKLHKNQLAALQQVLQFSFQWLPTCGATGTDITQAQGAIKYLYPVIVADTNKKKPSIKKP